MRAYEFTVLVAVRHSDFAIGVIYLNKTQCVLTTASEWFNLTPLAKRLCASAPS